MYRLSNDELTTLVQIICTELGDKLLQPEFNEAMLLLFEDIAGFETLPRKTARRYLKILWQSYETVRRAPERSQ